MIFPNTPTTDAAGMATERRFADALEKYTVHEPHWFLGVKEAPAQLDLRGVDFIAQVKYPRRREPVLVPIQIKGSEEGRRSYFVKHPKAKSAGVIVLVIKDKDDADSIRGGLFSELGRVRNAGRRYDDFLQRMSTKRVTLRGLRIIREIEERRGNAATPQTPTAPRKLAFLPPPVSRLEMLYYKVRRNLRLAVQSIVVPTLW